MNEFLVIITQRTDLTKFSSAVLEGVLNGDYEIPDWIRLRIKLYLEWSKSYSFLRAIVEDNPGSWKLMRE